MTSTGAPAQRVLTSVEIICAHQGNPYYELCYDQSQSSVLAKSLNGMAYLDVKAAYIYCGLVEDVHIFGRSFLYSKDDAYVFHCQSYLNYRQYAFEDCISTYIEGNRAELFRSYVEEECIFLGGAATEPTPEGPSHLVYGPNFGHFIFEYLGRLAIFDLYGLTARLPVVIYDCLPERWIGYLELAGIPRERLIRVPILNSPAYRKVWVSSAPQYRDSHNMARYWVAGLHWLRFRVLAAIGGPRLQDRRRLYLGRGDARWRKVANEGEVKRLLVGYGFEFPDMSRMSARAQVELMSGAELVVNTVGAGGVMLAFAPEHCIHLLFGPTGVGTGPFGGSATSSVLGHIFERIDCEAIADDGPRPLNVLGFSETADFIIDLGVLKEKVEAVLKDIPKRQARDALML